MKYILFVLVLICASVQAEPLTDYYGIQNDITYGGQEPAGQDAFYERERQREEQQREQEEQARSWEVKTEPEYCRYVVAGDGECG